MSLETVSTPPRPSDITLQDLDDLLDQVARLAGSDSSPQAFHLQLLDRAVRGLAAVGGAVWMRSRVGEWQIDARVDLSGQRLVESLADAQPHRDLLDAVIQNRQARIVLPQAGAAAGPGANPTEFLLLVCPIAPGDDGQPAGVLEIAQRPGGAPSSQQGYLRLLEALCELAADFHRQRRLRMLQELAASAGRVDDLAAAVHRSLDLLATATAVANEGRRLIECDRLSVAVRRGNSFRLLAVSGLETLDRRANLVRRLEDLTGAVVAAGEPFWFAGKVDALAPQIAGPLHAWQDESHARSLVIVPLRTGGAEESSADARETGAALVAECFSGDPPDDAYRQRVAIVCRHAELALENAREYEDFPFYRLLCSLKGARWFIEARRLPKTLAVAAALVLAVVALAVIPADFEIEGRGVLQPQDRQNVFARSDGIVSEVHTEHGQKCHAGDVLVVMTKSQLDFELSRVMGETQTARKRLASVEAARLDGSPQTAADREKYNQLTAEEEELQELLRSLGQQHEVLKAQSEDLVVKSPLDGQVVTWNVRQLLESRPVQRGQVLLQVADLDGPWVLEVEVPDDRVGHVLEAQQSTRKDLPVSFMLATEPGAVYRGAIQKVALATDVRPPETANVLITVGIDRDQVSQLRPNATALCRIDCGRRSLGFVWFHSFWEFIQKKVLF